MRLIFFMSVISTALGVLVTILNSKLYLKPVNRLIDQMSRLASGDFKARLSFGKPIGAHPTFVEMLQLPEGHKVVSCLVIGYPDVKYQRIVPRKEVQVKVL